MPGKQHLHKTIHQQHDDKKKKKQEAQAINTDVPSYQWN
jgi:hypothetical protein